MRCTPSNSVWPVCGACLGQDGLWVLPSRAPLPISAVCFPVVHRVSWTQAGRNVLATRFVLSQLLPSTSYYARIGAWLPSDPATMLYSDSSAAFTTPAETVVVPTLTKPGVPRCVSKRATALAWEWEPATCDVAQPVVTYKVEFAQAGLLSVWRCAIAPCASGCCLHRA
jgi:hypothetical protein